MNDKCLKNNNIGINGIDEVKDNVSQIVKSKKANSYYFHNNYNIKNAIEIYSVSGVLGRVLPQLVSSLLLHFSSCRA